MIDGLIAGLLATAISAFVTPFLEPAMTAATIFTWPPWRGFGNHPFYWVGIIISIALVVALNVLIGVVPGDEKVLAVRSVASVKAGVTVLNAVVGFFVIPGPLYFPRVWVERRDSTAREISLFQAAMALPTTEERIKRARLFLQVGLISPEAYDRWFPLL